MGIGPGAGAPAGNMHNLRHGGRTKRPSMPLTSALAERYPAIYMGVRVLRKQLEAMVKAADGSLTMKSAGLISLAIRYELTARIAELRVAKGESENPVSDLKTACWALANRNATIDKLGIDSDQADAVAAEATEAIDPAELYTDGESADTLS